jgi:putative ATPase
MRPRTLDEVVGHEALLARDSWFRKNLGERSTASFLFWGPPGSGKTTLARLVAAEGSRHFVQLSAVMSGIADLRKALDEARAARDDGRGTVLFVDEIHRWNKAQQDALLPHVETGLVQLVGATTENPAFQIIGALRSRARILALQPLAVEHVAALLERALHDRERGLAGRWTIDREGIELLALAADGDARKALSALERAAQAVPDGGPIPRATIVDVLGTKDLLHDRDGDAHFDVVSAFIKSMRGSDPDAALYWMARMLEAGEDPTYVARRMVIFAAEDVGNAEPRGITLAVACAEAARMVGMPEARIPLAQACVFLATAPKSNRSYQAIGKATEAVTGHGGLPVPLHLRNAPTGLAKRLGHGAEYRYPHDYPDHVVTQQYLPDELVGARFYEPSTVGAEKTIADRLEWWRDRLRKRSE